MAFDLDDEELEATRRIKGLIKNKPEEDIKSIKYYINQYVADDDIRIEDDFKFQDAIENLLKERQADKEKIKELEDKNRVRIIGKYGDVTLDELLKDKYIPIYKINNLIAQIKSAIDFTKTDKDRRNKARNTQKIIDLELEIKHLEKLMKED